MSSVRCPLLGEPLILTPSVLVAPGEFFIFEPDQTDMRLFLQAQTSGRLSCKANMAQMPDDIFLPSSVLPLLFSGSRFLPDSFLPFDE